MVKKIEGDHGDNEEALEGVLAPRPLYRKSQDFPGQAAFIRAFGPLSEHAWSPGVGVPGGMNRFMSNFPNTGVRVREVVDPRVF